MRRTEQRAGSASVRVYVRASRLKGGGGRNEHLARTGVGGGKGETGALA